MRMVLIVAENPFLIAILSRYLHLVGYAVGVVGGISDAQEKLKEHTLEAVIIDITMPGIDGIQTLAQEQLQFLEVPFLLATSSPTLGIATIQMEGGELSYRIKPLSLERMMELMEEARRYKEIGHGIIEDPFGDDNEPSPGIPPANPTPEVTALDLLFPDAPPPSPPSQSNGNHT